MRDESTWTESLPAILDDWIQRLALHRALMGHRDAIRSELGSWLELVAGAADGDIAASHELYKLVALHARELGAQARPPSAVLLQLLDLGAAIGRHHGEVDQQLQDILQQMAIVAVDAHSLGNAERLEAGHERRLREGAPVVQLGGCVLGFMIGPMRPQIIDAIAGRMLRICAGTGASLAILDISGADDDDERFHRTLRDFFVADTGGKIDRLIITGARNPGLTRAGLESVGADMGRISLRDELTAEMLG